MLRKNNNVRRYTNCAISKALLSKDSINLNIMNNTSHDAISESPAVLADVTFSSPNRAQRLLFYDEIRPLSLSETAQLFAGRVLATTLCKPNQQASLTINSRWTINVS